jgi:hypothetical protein
MNMIPALISGDPLTIPISRVFQFVVRDQEFLQKVLKAEKDFIHAVL